VARDDPGSAQLTDDWTSERHFGALLSMREQLAFSDLASIRHQKIEIVTREHKQAYSPSYP
jgi:hypothetical protein